MHSTAVVVLALVIGLLVEGGCQSASARKLLPAPTGVIAPAVQHHEEGILAYEQRQWAQARQHFEAAITAAPKPGGGALQSRHGLVQTESLQRRRSAFH